MKLTITNTAQNPTMIFLADKSTRDLAPGQTLKDIEVEDGQAGAYANQPGLDVVGYKKPAASGASPTTTGNGGVKLNEAIDRAVKAETEAEELLKRAETAEAEVTRLTAELADLGEEPTAEDDADDLRKQAIGLGIKVDKRWSDETVQRKIDEKLAS